MIFNSQGAAELKPFINGGTITPGDEVVLPKGAELLGDITIEAVDLEAIRMEGYNSGYEEGHAKGYEEGQAAALPYARVLEYIEATGTQRIDAGISVPHASARVVADFSPTAVSGSYYPITGHANTDFGWNTNFVFINNGYITLSGVQSSIVVSAGGRYVIDYTATRYAVNSAAFTTASRSYTDGYNDTIFYSSGYYGKLKLYSYKLYDGNTLVRDFIPVLDLFGVACLYDKVGKRLYYNQGSGEFAYSLAA